MLDRDISGRWGVLGGAFDPIHYGHLDLARGVVLARSLNGVLFVPSYRHPLKDDSATASYPHRVTMVRLAIADQDRFLIEEIEAERDLTGFTVDTMYALKLKYPAANLYFIIGADLLPQLSQWHAPDRLLAETNIVVGSRPGVPEDAEQAARLNVDYVTADSRDISSTQIRAMIRSGAPREQLLPLVPVSVLDYICKEQLYR